MGGIRGRGTGRGGGWDPKDSSPGSWQGRGRELLFAGRKKDRGADNLVHQVRARGGGGGGRGRGGRKGHKKYSPKGGRLRLARKQEGQRGGQLAVLVPCKMRTCRRRRRRKEGKQEIPLRALQEGRLLARGEYGGGGGGRKKGTLGILLQALQEGGGGGLRVARRQKRQRRRQLAVLVLCKRRRWRRKGPKESFSRLFTKGGFDSQGRNKDRVADIFLY